MINRFSIFTLLLSLILFTSMTCNQKGNVAETSSADCIIKENIKPATACTKEYNPVCGCNNETYGNPCMAKKAGVSRWTAGKCGDCIDGSKINPSAPCTREYVPVCGCNGKTYSNKCAAENAGLKSWKPGKCKTSDNTSNCIDPSKIDADALCMQVYQPVCGCDEKTYGNSCEAEKAGLTKWTDGACKDLPKDDCIDKSKITNMDCPDEYAPVCGCNGRTYPNACSARISGVLKWVDGKCK